MSKASKARSKEKRKLEKKARKMANMNKHKSGTKTSTAPIAQKRSGNEWGAKKTNHAKGLILGGPNPISLLDYKEEKRKDAIARQSYRATMTPREQIYELDRRLGKDVGAKKERARLLKLITDSPTPAF